MLKIVAQKNPQPPLLLAGRGPLSNTPMPRPTPFTTPNRRSDSSRTFAQLYRKVPIGYNGVPHIRPQNYLFPWTNPQTQLPALSLTPSYLPSQTASRSDALDRQTTDRHMV